MTNRIKTRLWARDDLVAIDEDGEVDEAEVEVEAVEVHPEGTETPLLNKMPLNRL